MKSLKRGVVFTQGLLNLAEVSL